MSTPQTQVNETSNKLFNKLTAVRAEEAAAQKETLPEPIVSAAVDEENAQIVVTMRFPIDYDEKLARMSKKTLVIGETQSPMTLLIDKDGEQQVLQFGGNTVAISARLGVRQEDQKTAETAAASEVEEPLAE